MNDYETVERQYRDSEDESIAAPQSQTRQPFVEPKLTFVAPRLVNHGDYADVTKQGCIPDPLGNFGCFSP